MNNNNSSPGPITLHEPGLTRHPFTFTMNTEASISGFRMPSQLETADRQTHICLAHQQRTPIYTAASTGLWSIEGHTRHKSDCLKRQGLQSPVPVMKQIQFSVTIDGRQEVVTTTDNICCLRKKKKHSSYQTPDKILTSQCTLHRESSSCFLTTSTQTF